MKFKKLIVRNWPVILYILLSVVSVIPFFMPGFFAFHDDVQVARIDQMAKALTSGYFPVRWVSDLGYGIGYPLFNFYSVLPYYIGGFLTLIGIDALISTKAVFVLGILGSGVSMYFLTNSFLGKIPALVSAIVYLYFPYHALNIYVRGDLAELFAYAILPLVFLSLFKIHEAHVPATKYVVLGALSIAAVIISHNLSAFMMFIFIGLFAFFSLFFSSNKRGHLISYLLVAALAFLLSAFYSVPAILEMGYTDVRSIIGGGSNYRDHFVCLAQLWDSPWGYGGSAPGCVDGISYKLGKLNVVLIILALSLSVISFNRLKENKYILYIAASFLAISIFMSLSYSSFFWSLPFMDFLQFPWRFLNFAGLFIALLSAFAVFLVEERWKKNTGIVLSALIIILTFVTNGRLFTPQEMQNRDFRYYTNSYYLNWTASKISDEYLPRGFVSPEKQADVHDSVLKFSRGPKNEYFRLKSYDPPRFIFASTPVENASNLVSVIGVIALIAVIMGKFDKILYGKKTS